MSMTVEQLVVINSTDDINIESLFQDSIDNFDGGTFLWPEDVITYEQKFNFWKAKVDNLFSQPSHFAFARIVDGVALTFNAGLKHGPTFVYAASLIAKINGSKAWPFNQELINQQIVFFKQNGINNIIIHSVKNSAMETFILGQYSAIPDIVISTSSESNDSRNTLITFPVDSV